MLFSIIIPVYNRPDEVEELLFSLTKQTDKEFEVIIVEDGSSLKCENVCAKYSAQLDMNYFYRNCALKIVCPSIRTFEREIG